MRKILFLFLGVIILFQTNVFCYEEGLEQNELSLKAKDIANEKLFNAIRFGKNHDIIDIEAAKQALKDGANPNYTKYVGERLKHFNVLSNWSFCLARPITPIEPCYNKDVLAMFELLFENGFKLNELNQADIYCFVARGWDEVLELYLKQGASATRWDFDGIGTYLTPIQVAIMSHQFDTAELLTKYGAEQPSPEEILQLLFIRECEFGDIETMKILLNKGAKINGYIRATNGDSYTPLISSFLDLLDF